MILLQYDSDNLPYEKVGKNEPVCIADEVPFEIPESWEWVTLKMIAITELGKTLDKAKNQGDYKPYLCSINVYWNGIDLTTVKEARFNENELPKYELKKGDLLICEGGDVGRSAIWENDQEMYYQNALHRVRFYGGIKPYYFRLLMECYKGNKILDEKSKGMTIKHLVQSALNAIYFPLPPIQEQQRIVDKFQSLIPILEQYNTSEIKLSNLNIGFPDLLKKSILQEAVQGKLVPQDSSDEPASLLLERIRAEKQKLISEGKIKKDKHESVIFRRDNSHYEKRGSEEVCIDEDIPFDIPENWTWTRLQNICSLIGDIDHNMPKSVPADEGVLFLSAKDLLDDGTINYTQNVKYISRADFERLSRKALPQKNDIIYSRIGAALGKARLVEMSKEFLVSYSCCVVRPLLVYPPYIRYYLESPQILLHSIKARQSIGVPDLGMGEIKKYLVALPPYNEQIRIVKQLKVLLDRCNFKM
ncbi:restriction endonuclease subunit S [Mediterraneibacter massiliensis]|uniref:restriction endonuclease subunit S n=1 Tax=Mediterraneibacter massiliensis TaxID=1720300 RepID=UPI0022DFEA69|nr:restriction endonuclease subunit S [Mediterraneibacter massiliensis]